MRVLNLYAGIGGNRKLWTDCEITAVEINPDIAEVYKHFFSEDIVIIEDAHKYLLNHFNEFDFIWNSPPCQSHSTIRQFIGIGSGQVNPIYPNMKLYQEVIFLKNNFKGKYCIENVKPYYKPLIKPTNIIGRHLYWCNFLINRYDTTKQSDNCEHGTIKLWQDKYGFNLSDFKLKRKDQILRNCVTPEVGLHIFNNAKKIKTGNKRINKLNLSNYTNND